MVEFDGFGIAITVFIVITLVVGVLAGRLVRHSGKRLIVAGKSLPLAMVGTMLAAQAVDGNSSLGNISLVFEFGFWAGAVTPIGLGVGCFRFTLDGFLDDFFLKLPNTSKIKRLRHIY